jgi:penicillin-binding protein 1A
MTRRQTRRRRLPRFGRLLRRFVFGTIVVGLLLAGGAGYLFFDEIRSTLPPIDAAVDYRPPVATQIFANDGTVIGEFFSEKRYLVPLDRIPQHVRQAFIAAEDDGFYQHKGVDPFSIARAFINNLAAGGKVQGGSTITQQVVKALFLSPRKSYERKVREMLLSLRLEQELSKDEILTLYLNHIYLGSGAYGVAAAAREYFGKDISQVDIAEAALLAGLPQAPSRYSPFRHWPQSKARQRYVLKRMEESGFITAEQRDAAARQPLSLETRRGSYRAASHYVEYIRRTLEERYGRSLVYDLGLRVHTAVDVRMQEAAEKALRHGLEELNERHHGYRSGFRELEPEQREAYLRQQEALVGDTLQPSESYEGLVVAVRAGAARVQVGKFSGELESAAEDGTGLPKLALNDLVRVRVNEAGEDGPPSFYYDPTPLVEGAMVVIDPRTGAVKAMVGGYDFERSQFNRVTQAKRQPGSSFKPFVYAAALDRRFTPASVIVDEPVFYSDNGKVWSPQNFEKRNYGPTVLRDALAFSRNVVTVKLADAIGVKYLVRYLDHFGLQGPFAPNLSIALGSAEVTTLEMALGYCVFANNGKLPRATFITEVTDSSGQAIEQNPPELKDAIPPPTAYLMTSMLQDVVSRGTGRRAQGLGRPTAGKTGTTNDLHDAWFIGYTPELLAAVWVGFDSKRPLGKQETGGHVSAPIWKEFMSEALTGIEPHEFAIPEGLKCININPKSGSRATADGPSRLECFREGTEPAVGSMPAVQLVEDQPSPKSSSALDFLRHDF